MGSTYSVIDAHGTAIAQGLDAATAQRVAGDIATRRGTSVWVYGPDDTDETAVEVGPRVKTVVCEIRGKNQYGQWETIPHGQYTIEDYGSPAAANDAARFDLEQLIAENDPDSGFTADSLQVFGWVYGPDDDQE